ncbi:TonB-dependent receptor [Salegentibacter mishustinae]|uniref:TonB-dependent receptor n=1 Tax=Salegentibacter mishustinae TaxID=270918 RepID=UPI001CE21C23|nr:TonB-dependent receptor [Salegentibacter mishustinae]UBZ08302.1 TonB-dependent receptor [Salegentibacter mishustinae]
MRKLLALAMFLTSATIFAQGTLTGTVLDSEMNGPLPGATVMVVGTNNGTTTDFDGNFSLDVKSASGRISITFIGYERKTIKFDVANGATQDLGTIALGVDADALAEVVITGIADLAKDRETPVAVSTIRAAEIQEKLGSQEFPEILNNTPSIYATKQGGGFGDARINIRGFDTNNSAVMINGVPINDMENGAVYWSNWAGLSDVASAIQVQRGLGSSKLAVSSVGGTINVITRAADRAEGGFVTAMAGNDSYLKTVASYNTGLMESGFSTTVLLSQTQGDGYIDGTEFQGYNYYLGFGYRPNDTHDFQFTVTGAPQWHNQRSRSSSIDTYQRYSDNDDPNIKYNEEWGYLNGEEYSFRRNFYHKPIMSLNWDFDINSKTQLSTSAYASFGRGGGTGEIGTINGRRQFALPRTNDGLIRVDDIFAYNSGQAVPDFGNDSNPEGQRTLTDGIYLNQGNNDRSSANGITRRASINSHNWFGVLSNLSNQLTDELTLDVGIDLRTYKGIHYRRVNDLLGGDAYLQTDNDNNVPNPVLRETYDADPNFWVFSDIDSEEKIDYYNDGLVRWAGTFGQLEYNNEVISAFVQGSISNQGFKRVEYFGELEGNQETDWENIIGGNIKGGLNWNIDEMHNIYANAGYYSKQPLFDAVYINFGNNLNPDLQNEQVIGTEIGYGFRSSFFSANVNLYRTSWADRFESDGAVFNAETPQEIRGTANLYGITQVHTGLEIDFTGRISDKLGFNGMMSIGNWEYDGDVEATYFDNDQSPILDENGNPQTATLALDGVKVGDAPQFTASIGADYEIIEGLGVDANYRYVDNLYADFDATDALGEENFEALKLPSFGLVDAGASFRLPIGKNNNNLNFRVNVNNVFDTMYISEADTNLLAGPGDETYDGVNVNNRVYFGFGRTWNAGVTFNF